MPRGDRTGPDGRGPMTGRGFGYCAGYPGPGYERGTGMGRGRGYGRGSGRGYGQGRGFGRRRGWRCFEDVAPYQDTYREEIPIYREPLSRAPTPEEEKSYLEGVLADIMDEAKAIKERIKALGKKNE